MTARRCAYCSDTATRTVVDKTDRRRPACGSCAHMIEGRATSFRGVENRDGQVLEEQRRRRLGGRGRFAQG